MRLIMNNARREASRHFRNKKREYVEDQIMSLQQAVKTRTQETCIGEQMNIRRFINLAVS
jgi:hypothetical protein